MSREAALSSQNVTGSENEITQRLPVLFAGCADEMSESRQTHVTLHDIDPQALEQLVQYAYTAEIVVGEGNVQVKNGPIASHCGLVQRTHAVVSASASQTLLPAASLLQLNGVRDACCKFLLSQLDPSNCLGIRGFADTHSCSDLLKSAHKYVLQHFVEVSKTEEFMLLPLKQVGGFALVGGIHDKYHESMKENLCHCAAALKLGQRKTKGDIE